MTTANDWTGRVGQTWAAEWQRIERSFAALAPHLDAAIRTAASDAPIRVLDIGCGAGSTGLALAAARPHATITGVDLSTDLLAVARDRGAGHANLTFRQGDATAVAADLAPLDLLLSRHGVMFFADPVVAFTGLRQASRPGASLVFSCFRHRADNPWASDLVEQVTGTPPPAASGYAPGPFGFADPAVTAAILSDAGWTIDGHARVDFGYRVGAGDDPVADAAAFFRRIGPLASALRQAPDPATSNARLKTALERYRTDNDVVFPASAWIWRATANQGERA
ncbi:SAM-dependent methyltransferase [Sphingomonas insulae]|uniref:Class I SAM-dependent methyltransferase n=1 Tax=Sphingomonas insulae TaxID=424800 RepID=A0ABN1HR09_9SPHN|nr:class I SAM-dependent methyltransferase [Sphingomonas insulae]NIJ29275.1 SAM-dependent methyltransferase [Sphingomonas insulae]